MAIQADVTLRNGVAITDAYILVEVENSKIKWHGIMIYIYVFASPLARENLLYASEAKFGYGHNSSEYADNFSESGLVEPGKTLLTSAYNFVKARISAQDADFIQRLGFDIDAATMQDI